MQYAISQKKTFELQIRSLSTPVLRFLRYTKDCNRLAFFAKGSPEGLLLEHISHFSAFPQTSCLHLPLSVFFSPYSRSQVVHHRHGSMMLSHRRKVRRKQSLQRDWIYYSLVVSLMTQTTLSSQSGGTMTTKDSLLGRIGMLPLLPASSRADRHV